VGERRPAFKAGQSGWAVVDQLCFYQGLIARQARAYFSHHELDARRLISRRQH
jgi:hypothetical protein